jgi:hypothetical protein
MFGRTLQYFCSECGNELVKSRRDIDYNGFHTSQECLKCGYTLLYGTIRKKGDVNIERHSDNCKIVSKEEESEWHSLSLELKFLNCKHTALRETEADADDIQLGDVYYCKECKCLRQVGTIIRMLPSSLE